jgi:hypothetical protein
MAGSATMFLFRSCNAKTESSELLASIPATSAEAGPAR